MDSSPTAMASSNSNEEDAEREQLYHNLEQRYITLHKDYDNIYNDNNLLKRKVTTLEDELLNLKNSAATMTFDSSKYESEIKMRDTKFRHLEYENEKLNDDYKRKCDECDRLRDDLKSQADQIISFQSRLREIQSLLSENESQLLPLQYELNTVKREKELYENRNQFLESELEKKSTEFYQAKRDHLLALQDLELQLAQKNNECGEYQEKLKQFEDRLTVQNEKIDQYLNQIQTLEENKNVQQDDFLKELTAQKKLVDLYKMNLEDSLKHIERLEENLSSLTSSYTAQSNSHKLKIQEIHSGYEEKFKQLEQQKKEQMEELERQIVELKNDQQFQKENNDFSNNSAAAAAAAAGGGVMVRLQHHGNEEVYLPTEYELIGKGYSLTTMYCQVIQLEKDLNNEKLRKQELELYLDRILRDIENKAPMIASLRRDHMRLIESHDQLTKKLDGVINENNKFKKLNMRLEKESQEISTESSQLTLMNQDLCKQIQHLLRYQNSGSNELNSEQQQFYQQQLSLLTQQLRQSGNNVSIDSNDVISEYLVTYETIDELQKRNIQLLSIVRKLSTEQEDKVSMSRRGSQDGQQLTVISSSEDVQTTLDQTFAELEMMRESRQRMEDMVSSLIQQRDIYRAMLEDVDGAAGPTQRMSAGGSSSMPTTPTRQSSNKQMEALQMKLGETEEALHKYQDRCTRLEHAEETLNVSLENLRNECSTLRSQLVHTTSSSQFLQNRVSSLESSLQSLQSSYELLSNKKSEMDGILITHQKSLQEKENKISEISDQLRSNLEQARRACLERDVLKEQEKRLYDQILEQKEEIKKQSQLTESMYRIETSITSNLTNQNKKLEDEIEMLKNQLRSFEKSEREYKLITEQKLSNATDEIKLLMLNYQSKQTEVNELKELYLKEQNQSTVSYERAVILEKQLSLTQERLSQYQSNNITNEMVMNENSEKELMIEKQLLEIQKLTNELRIVKDTNDQFQQINLQTEKIFKEYQQKSMESKHQLELEKNELLNELNELKTELNEKKEQVMEIRRENETLHETLQNKTKELSQEMSLYQEELSKSQELEGRYDEQVLSLKKELEMVQRLLNESNQNYERELMQHSASVKKFQEMEIRCGTFQKNSVELSNKFNDMAMKCMEYEKMLESQKSHAESTITGLQEQLLTLKHTNDLLHNQVQIMSYEINKNTFQTMQRVTADDPLIASASSVNEGALTQEMTQEEGQDSSSTTLQQQQQSQQQTYYQTISELRDVIKYMKREKDMLDAKFTICEMEKTRYVNETMSLTKALDEVKLELQREMKGNKEKNSSSSSLLKSEEEIQSLLNEVNQLNILRDSNVHLRNENLEKSQVINGLNDKLAKIQQEMMPLNERIITLESQLNILTSEKQSLLTDCNYWKDRLHQLISRYNDVDPEEHRLLKEKLEKTEQLYQTTLVENETLQKKLVETEKQLKSCSDELTLAKSTAETMEKTSENLRGRLREFNKQLQTQRAQMTQLNATCDSHQQKITEQQNTIQKLQQDVVVANTATQDATAQATSANAALATAQSLLSKQPQKTQVEASGVTSSTVTETEVTKSVPQETVTAASAVATVTPATPVAVAPAVSSPPPQDKLTDLQRLREAAMKRMSAKRTPSESEGTETPAQKKARPAVAAPAVASPQAPPSQAPPQVPPQAPPAKCYYYSTPAGCRNGDSCRFLHVIEDQPPQSQPSEEMEEASTQQPDPTPTPVIDESPQPEGAEESQQEVASKDMDIVTDEQTTKEETPAPSEQVTEAPIQDTVETLPSGNDSKEVPVDAPPPTTVPPATVSTTEPSAAPKPFGSNTAFPTFSSFRAQGTPGPFSFASGDSKKSSFTSPSASVGTSGTTPANVESGTAAPVSAPSSSSMLSFTSKFTPPAAASPAAASAAGFKGFGSSLFRQGQPGPALGKIGGLFPAKASPQTVVPPAATSAPSAAAPQETVAPEQPVEEPLAEATAPLVEEENQNEGDMEEAEGEETNEAPDQSAGDASDPSGNVAIPTKVTMTAEQRRLARFARFKKEKPAGKKGKQGKQPPGGGAEGGGSAQQE